LACIALAAGVIFLARRWLDQRRERIERRLLGASSKTPSLAISREYLQSHTKSGRFDRWFNALVGQTGMQVGPQAAFLIALFAGLLLGGSVLLWRDDFLESAAATVVGILLVFGYYLVLRNRRRVAMQEQLPDVMELLARAVRAGETLDQAIDLVGDATQEPLGVEFRTCARQLQMGLSVDSAMQAMVRRIPLTEMRILATTLTVQRQTGGNLPTTLERLSRVVRDRISYHRQFRAATGAGRISTILIGAAGPLAAAYMLFWQREYFDRFTDTLPGQLLLASAIALQFIGMLWIYLLLRSDY
jgi:tight adherence protein B